ncbi:phosphotransferase [Sulfitobacter pontiacus]|uniref:phosphotransferase n=1 Tax=Sulfitobacter pontiacus TaxID=60137 RepID=UPI001FCA4FE1|nr:phosphotransferase [Sulfitobacter pontiacus]
MQWISSRKRLPISLLKLSEARLRSRSSGLRAGSNPTYFVTRGDVRLVLRKQPGGPILRGAHAIDREYRVLEALHPQGVPVARPILYHADPDLLGTPFYLMERIEGRVFAEGALAAADKKNAMPCGWVWPTRWPPCTTSAPKR